MYELKRALNDTRDVYAELGAIVDEAEAAFDTEKDRQYIAERVVLRLIGVLNAWPESAGRGPAGAQVATTPLVELVGVVAHNQLEDASDEWKARLDLWARSLRSMDDVEFIAEAASAVARNSPTQARRGFDPERFKEAACCFESWRRWFEEEHAKGCGGSTLYEIAFRDKDMYPVRKCTCGARAGSGKTGG